MSEPRPKTTDEFIKERNLEVEFYTLNTVAGSILAALIQHGHIRSAIATEEDWQAARALAIRQARALLAETKG